MFTILHISDLHRSQDEPVSNEDLLAALLADRDRYLGEEPRIPPPRAIVVSGDLIWGESIGAPNWQKSIQDQYRVAASLLTQFCERFLDGDKSRLILTPGNHDVCWNTSFLAMERVPQHEYPDDVQRELAHVDSPYRWSWTEMALYLIRDFSKYEQRMNYYWDFFENFYDGVTLPIPIDRNRGFQLYEINDRQTIVAAFDSINRNDCFNYAGAIRRGVVAKCAIGMRELRRAYNPKIAVWHHSIQGPPNHSDYMDAHEIQKMLGYGFQLGLHGHQHVAGTLTQYVHLDQSQSMAVVSAGSLCAGAKELPRGVNRQYNLIVVEDELNRARVHVREMGDGEQFTRKRDGAFLQGFQEVGWQPQTNVMGISVNVSESNLRSAIIEAEIALRESRPADAVAALDGLEMASQPYARRLLIDALSSQKKWLRLTACLGAPISAYEEVVLVSALIEIGDLDKAMRAIRAARHLDVATGSSLEERIETMRIIKNS